MFKLSIPSQNLCKVVLDVSLTQTTFILIRARKLEKNISEGIRPVLGPKYTGSYV